MQYISISFLQNLFVFIFFVNTIQSQDYDRVDALVSNYSSSYDNIDDLVFQINKDFNDPKEQVRAAFHWIASHIKYNSRESGVLNKPISFRTEAEYERKRIEARRRLAQRVIQRKVAVCEGYSSLFKEICDGLNITNEIVTGCAKNQYNDIGQAFDSNHAWNLVYINNKPLLIDSTWGALLEGTIGDRSSIEWYYFFPDPSTLIRSHYPDEPRNSLLKSIPSRESFMLGPLYYNENLEPDFELIKPKQNGLLISNKEHTFTFKSQIPIQFIGYSVDEKYEQIDDYILNEDILEFSVFIPKTKAAEVLVFLNGDAVVAYKTQ